MPIDLNAIRDADLAARAERRNRKRQRAEQRAQGEPVITPEALRRVTEHGHLCPQCGAEELCRRPQCNIQRTAPGLCKACWRKANGKKVVS